MATTWEGSTTCKPQPSRIVSPAFDTNQFLQRLSSRFTQSPRRIQTALVYPRLGSISCKALSSSVNGIGCILSSSHLQDMVINFADDCFWNQTRPVQEQLQWHPRVKIEVLRETGDTNLEIDSKALTESRLFLCIVVENVHLVRSAQVVIWDLSSVWVSTRSSNNTRTVNPFPEVGTRSFSAAWVSWESFDLSSTLAGVVRRDARRLQMSFCGAFPFVSRPRGTRETSEAGFIMSYHPVFDQEQDLCPHSRDWGWSFEEFDEFSFVRQVELEKETDMESNNTSSHLSLTTGSLLRLITENDAVAGIITSKKTLAPAQTPILRPRGPSLNNHASFASLTASTRTSSPCTQSSTSLLDLYLLQASSCSNAGNEITLPSSAVMDGQPPKDKGVGHPSGSTTLSALEDLVEAYASSEHSDDSHAFIHAGDLNRQSYIDARLEVAAALAPASTPGPAPSILPPMPAYRSALFREDLLDESEVGVPTPPTRILDHAGAGRLTRHKPDLWGAVDHEFSCRPLDKRSDHEAVGVELQNLTHGRILDVPSFPYPVSNFLSGLNPGVFEAEESEADSTTAQRQSDDVVATFGEVSTFKVHDVDPANYRLFPRAEFTPHFDPQQLRSRACNRAVGSPSRLSRPFNNYTMEPYQRPIAPLNQRPRHPNCKEPFIATLPKGKDISRSGTPPVSVVDNSPSKSDVSYPSDRILTPYKSYIQLSNSPGQQDDITPGLPASVHTQPSSASMATTIPIDNSGYDDNQDLALKRQDELPPRALEASGSHNLVNDTAELERDIYGKRRSWALFVLCTIFPPVLLLYGFGGFDKFMVHIANAHAQPTKYQKKFAIFFSLAETLLVATLAA